MMQIANISETARFFGRNLHFTPEMRAWLATLRIYAVGYGSIARPACEALAEGGVRRFVLVDPKKYTERSVQSQCDSEDVGRFKVEVGAERLAAHGAEVVALPADVGTVPDGWVDPSTVVLVSADNRRADLLANQLALRMRVPLVKANIEPRFDFVSVRTYNLRHHVEMCSECQMSDAARSRQRHPRSCDGPEVRHTAAPRVLSRAAGLVAVLACMELGVPETAQSWFGRQWQFMLEDRRPVSLELTPSAVCRCEHDSAWPNLEWLPQSPEEVTLGGLLRMADASDVAELRLCQQLTLEVCCDRCHGTEQTVRWLQHVSAPVGPCQCGGRLMPVPFRTYREVPVERLHAIHDQPLAAWGILPHAVLQITSHECRRSFVVGTGRTTSQRTDCRQGAFS